MTASLTGLLEMALMFRGFLVAAAIGLLPPAASAQTQATLDAYKAINAAVPAPPVATVNLEATALLKTMVERKEAPCLPTRVALGEIMPATASRLATDGINAKQLKNVWTAYGRLEGCPGTIPARFLIIRLPDDSLRVRIINNGETLTSSSQMRDTSGQAAVAAYVAVRKADPACTGDGMSMGDTRVATRSADLGPDVYGVRYVGSWREVWRFKVCGTEVDVPVDFRADGAGGVYTNIPGGEVVLVKR